MHPFVNTAVKAAREAGKVIMRAYDRVDALAATEKSSKNYVTEVDHASEAAIFKILRKAYPSHSILSEESGLHKGDEYQWIIDPLDGTHNFIHRFPYFCISIAVRDQDHILHGVVYNPLTDELFTASKGAGAQKNNYKLRINPKLSLEKSLLGISLHSTAETDREAFHQASADLASEVLAVRRPGAAALDLAYVASSQLSAYFAMGLKIWDLAAGSLLITEAGGVISDLKGGDRYLEEGLPLVAGNIKTYRDILEIVKKRFQ